ncbi:MAG TPA: hypothetical protein VJ877_06485 [Bacteroidales bacterium]|nr:hypothetical protein [Bacteroidales bacterium]
MGQGKKSEDNVVAVFYKAVRHYGIRVSITSIRDYLQRHPYYLSLKSVCDAFTKWNIDHYPLKLTGNEINRHKICKDLSIEQNTQGIMSILSDWYRNLENRTRMQIPEFKSSDLQASEGILNVNKELFRNNKISGTPTILINNYKYPGQYEITDLEYYIDDIIELLEKKKARSPHPI